MSISFKELFSEWERNNNIENKDNESAQKKTAIYNKKSKQEKIPAIDLHGMYKEEALKSLNSFIIKNQSGNEKKILIIHGVGRHSENKRVLKEAVKDWLKSRSDLIKSFRPGKIGEGSTGVTVATLFSASNKKGK